MSKGAKQNWFESPHVKNSLWFLHDDKIDMFNPLKQTVSERLIFLTPSHQSRPIQFEKNLKIEINQYNEAENSKFQDINLPDMFSNIIVQRQVINEKLNFEEQSIISDDRYQTPSLNRENGKEVRPTAFKQGELNQHEEKKSRPKQKGLRMLSQKAYQIVLRMNGATYKEVANKLVAELTIEDSVEINGKDQQNIKRRVYDALNVLIALGILKKDGRKIFGLKNKNLIEEEKIEEFKKIVRENQKKKQAIMEKMKQLKSLKSKAQLLKAFVKRNQFFPSTERKIQFPFLAIPAEQKDQISYTQIEGKFSLRKNDVEIFSQEKTPQAFCFTDIIQFLRPALRSFIQ